MIRPLRRALNVMLPHPGFMAGKELAATFSVQPLTPAETAQCDSFAWLRRER